MPNEINYIELAEKCIKKAGGSKRKAGREVTKIGIELYKFKSTDQRLLDDQKINCILRGQVKLDYHTVKAMGEYAGVKV